MRCVVVLCFLLLVSCATASRPGTYSAKAPYDHLLARRMVYYSASAYAPPSAVRFYSFPPPRGVLLPTGLGLNAAATQTSPDHVLEFPEP
jgi:hypothetical protein